MATRIIFYHLKSTMPKDERAKWAIVTTAYRTARGFESNPRQILIRGDIHSTTTKDGKLVKDRPHITISVKNNDQVRNQTHISVHGYTNTSDLKQTPTEITSVPTDAKADDTKDRRGRVIWPTNLEQYSVIYIDPVDLETLTEEALREKYR